MGRSQADLYQYADQRIGVGRYCLMCLGASPDPGRPTQVGAYLRYRAAWGQATPLTADRHQHAECVLLQADGADDLGRGNGDGDSRDLFGPDPGPVFVDGTPLAARWWDGSPAGLQIHSLEADGDDLLFVAELG